MPNISICDYEIEKYVRQNSFWCFFLKTFTQFPDILQSRKILKAKQVAFVQILFLNHLKKILE